jgi:hypothetical protein
MYNLNMPVEIHKRRQSQKGDPMNRQSPMPDPLYDLNRQLVDPAPRETLPAEFRDLLLGEPRPRNPRKTRLHNFLLGLRAAAERSPLMGLYAALTGARD